MKALKGFWHPRRSQRYMSAMPTWPRVRTVPAPSMRLGCSKLVLTAPSTSGLRQCIWFWRSRWMRGRLTETICDFCSRSEANALLVRQFPVARRLQGVDAASGPVWRHCRAFTSPTVLAAELPTLMTSREPPSQVFRHPQFLI